MKRELRISASVLATIAAMATAGGAVAQQQAAQDPSTETVDAIIVTGIRGSLREGIQAKRATTQFIDSIVAEDIGKLPDNNIAESLQRVSGVQIRRSLGEGTSVSIRGLRQNRTEVNGRTLVGPFGRGPGVPADADYTPLSLYPAEIINRLEVTKLLSADQSDGSLGGTVNIVTRRPLDGGDRLLAASAEVSHSDLSKHEGYSGAVLASQRFGDGNFGGLINVTYSDRPVQEDSFNSFAGFLPLTSAFTFGGASQADPNKDGVPGTYIADLRYQILRERRERVGVNGVLQWKPTDKLEFIADAIYSKGQAKRRRNWFAVALTSAGSDYLSYTFSPNEVLVAGTVNRPLQGNDERLKIDDHEFSSAFSGKYDAGPLQVKGEISFSDAHLAYNQTYVRTQTAANYITSFDFRAGDVPSLTLPTGVNLMDPSLYRYSNIFDNRFISDATEWAGKVDVTYDLNKGLLKSLQFGAKTASLDTKRDSLLSQITSTVGLPSLSANLYEAVNFSGLLQGKAPFAEKYLAGNPFGTGADFACQAIVTTCSPRTLDPTASYKIDETTNAAYAKVNVDGDLGAIPVSGNFGLRYTQTDRDASSGLRRADGSYAPIDASITFKDWLPSGVLKFDLTDKLVGRVGAAKVVGLPDSQDLSPGLLLNRVVFTATGGNPNLAPFRATQYDASLEWYFREGSALTVGAFYKDIGSFLSTRAQYEAVPGETQQFLVTRKVNGQGGSLKGVEVLLQLPLDFLPASLSGFGILTNYSYIESETLFQNARTKALLPLEGLSKHNANLVAYYEKNGFGARIAYNYRSAFLDSVTAGGEGSFFKPYDTIDASVRYEVGAFAVSLEASNLTNEAQVRYTGSPEATALYAIQGRRFALGLSARF